MFIKKTQYTALDSQSEHSNDETQLEGSPHRVRYILPFLRYILLVAMIVSCSVLSFHVGSQRTALRHPLCDESMSTIPLSIRPHTLTYQRPFADDPALRPTDIWDTIFPNNGTVGGYFSHPTIAPQRSTFSAFHQLHCLHAIREAYYDAINTSESRHSHSSHANMPSHTSPAHIRHCIDLIRQSLMCYADTTIEVKDEEINGVRGFGTVHMCRDWSGLVRWTEETQEKYGMGETLKGV
ncbi:Tat pathway signal sequence protein [Rutstroemia sp. NJR-2017a WRK4]|nr:Tat pathway signal sequence protein [Rutstroemia sp. NJR-2017a WRK4]